MAECTQRELTSKSPSVLVDLRVERFEAPRGVFLRSPPFSFPLPPLWHCSLFLSLSFSFFLFLSLSSLFLSLSFSLSLPSKKRRFTFGFTHKFMHGEGFLQVFYYFEADYNPIITGRFLIANKKPANPESFLFLLFPP